MEHEFVIGVKNIERECHLQPFEGCWIPPYAKKLAILIYLGVPNACAELDVDFVDPIVVNHCKELGFEGDWTRGVFVADVKTMI